VLGGRRRWGTGLAALGKLALAGNGGLSETLCDVVVGASDVVLVDSEGIYSGEGIEGGGEDGEGGDCEEVEEVEASHRCRELARSVGE